MLPFPSEELSTFPKQVHPGRIVASAVTGREVDDGAQAGPLLDQVGGHTEASFTERRWVRSRTLMLLFLYGSSKRKRSICPALRLRKAVTVASASGNRCSFMGGRGPATITPLRMR